jgi:hypothetical protein
MVIYVTFSNTLLSWSDAAGKVPTKAFPVVAIMTPVSVLLVIDWVHYRCCIQHCLEPLHLRVDLFIILGSWGVI